MIESPNTELTLRERESVQRYKLEWETNWDWDVNLIGESKVCLAKLNQ